MRLSSLGVLLLLQITRIDAAAPHAREEETTLRNLMKKHNVQDVQQLLNTATKLRAGAKKKPNLSLHIYQAIANAMHLDGMTAHAEEATALLAEMYLFAYAPVRDLEKAVTLLQTAADQGNPRAQFWLGILHSHGIGVARDPPLAATYLYFAAEGGSDSAQYVMGYRHFLGVQAPKKCSKAKMYYASVAEGVVARVNAGSQNRVIEKVRLTYETWPSAFSKQEGVADEVLQYYEQSARKGSVDAQLTLAQIHYHGARGLDPNPERAFQYFSQAAEAGESAAYSHLGHMYAEGIGVEPNNSTAFDYFLKGAESDSAPAQNGLGYMFMHGYSVPRSYQKALQYFKQAAEKGNAEAQFNLGAMYVSGMGVKRSPEKATHWFTLSAHQGHTLALYNLAQMHSNGVGTPASCQVAVSFLKGVSERGHWGSMLANGYEALAEKDAEASLVIYLALAESGYEVAQANAGYIIDQHLIRSTKVPLLGLQGDSLAHLALEMFRRSAQQGNSDSDIKLGDYYYYGSGTNVSLDSSLQHYRAAAEARNAQAMFNLAYMYAHGLGLPVDYHLAKRHYDNALEAEAKAYFPVSLALLELQFLELWKGFDASGSSAVGQFGHLVANTLRDGRALVAARSVLTQVAESEFAREFAQLFGSDVIEWDTLLILFLTGLLVLVLLARWRTR